MDGFGSHLELFDFIFEYKQPDTILEFGMGDFSTPYFIKKAKKEVVSIEMQMEDWFNKINEKFKNEPKWTGIKSIGPFNFMQLGIYKKYDVIFVDGHGSSRPECINFVQNFTDNIVVHDTETASYRWNMISLPIEFRKIEYTKSRPWTTLFTKDLELLNFVKGKL